mmetsp:Transcript_15850/g.23861  ORF Transcript_15850/g.23861 Transcript_15850/m.23861 type:complete len:303 (+) Transcript_15850:41-949(+)
MMDDILPGTIKVRPVINRDEICVDDDEQGGFDPLMSKAERLKARQGTWQAQQKRQPKRMHSEDPSCAMDSPETGSQSRRVSARAGDGHGFRHTPMTAADVVQVDLDAGDSVPVPEAHVKESFSSFVDIEDDEDEEPQLNERRTSSISKIVLTVRVVSTSHHYFCPLDETLKDFLVPKASVLCGIAAERLSLSLSADGEPIDLGKTPRQLGLKARQCLFAEQMALPSVKLRLRYSSGGKELNEVLSHPLDAPLAQLLDSFCAKHQEIRRSSAKLVENGDILQLSDTPRSCDLVEDDLLLDVVV